MTDMLPKPVIEIRSGGRGYRIFFSDLPTFRGEGRTLVEAIDTLNDLLTADYEAQQDTDIDEDIEAKIARLFAQSRAIQALAQQRPGVQNFPSRPFG